jgi:hypothetical protein
MKTYSFKDVIGVILHPTLAPAGYQFNGQGAGEIGVSMLNERTVHEPAADGVVMISKIEVHNGTVSVHCNQNSELNNFLQGLYNGLDVADASEWALTTIYIRSIATGMTHTCTGVSPQKDPDKVYRKQGDMVTWVFMAASIVTQNA